MADKQVNIALTASDEASGKIEEVAREAGELERLDPTVEVAADTQQAKRSVSELIDLTDQLDSESATIVLQVRAREAQRALNDALEEVGRLDAADPTITVAVAAAADAKADLDALQTKIKDLNSTKVDIPVDSSGLEHYRGEAGKAQDATHSFVGNALSELPGVGTTFGPLSEAVGQMTEGLLAGEIAMGGLIQAALPIAGVTVAVKLISDAFAAARHRAEEARKRVDEYVKALQEADEKGTDALEAINDKTREAAQSNQDLIDSATDLGLTYDDIEAAINGKVTPALQAQLDLQGQINDAITDESAARARGETSSAYEDLATQLGMTTDQLTATGTALDTVTGFIKDQGGAVKSAKGDNSAYLKFFTDLPGKVKPANGDLQTFSEKVEASTDALEHANRQLQIMKDRLNMKADIRELEQMMGGLALKIGSGAQASVEELDAIRLKIIDIADEAGKSPIEVNMALDMLDRGDIQGALAVAQGWANEGIGVPVFLKPPTRSEVNDLLASIGGTVVLDTAVGGRAAAASVVNVTQVFPRGFRGSSVIEEARTAARRNGGLYQRALL